MKKLLALLLALLMCFALLPSVMAEEATDSDQPSEEPIEFDYDQNAEESAISEDFTIVSYKDSRDDGIEETKEAKAQSLSLTASQVQSKISAYVNEVGSDGKTRYWNKGMSGSTLIATAVPGKYKDCTTTTGGRDFKYSACCIKLECID